VSLAVTVLVTPFNVIVGSDWVTKYAPYCHRNHCVVYPLALEVVEELYHWDLYNEFTQIAWGYILLKLITGLNETQLFESCENSLL